MIVADQNYQENVCKLLLTRDALSEMIADFGPGDVMNIPSGHDAWVVGDEPVVIIDISGMAEYAKRK